MIEDPTLRRIHVSKFDTTDATQKCRFADDQMTEVRRVDFNLFGTIAAFGYDRLIQPELRLFRCQPISRAQTFHHLAGRRMRIGRGHWSSVEEVSGLQADHVLRFAQGCLGDVGGEYEGTIIRLQILPNRRPIAGDSRGVDVSERFVEHEHFCRRAERSRHGESRTLPLTQLVRTYIGPFCKIECREQFIHPHLSAAHQLEVFAYGAMRPKPVILRGPVERLGRIEDSAVRPFEADEQVQQ